MGVLKQDVKVPTTPDKLWETFADLRRLPDWLTMHVKFKSEVPAPTDYRVGITISQVISMLGMPNTIEWTVVEYQALKAVKITGTGMAGVRVGFTFAVESADGWTFGRLDAEFNGQIIVGALGKAIEKEGLKQLKLSLRNLADLLVAEGVISEHQREQVEFIDPAPATA